MYLPDNIKKLNCIYNDGLLWINIEKPKKDDMNDIAKTFAFHELNIDDCLSKNQLAKIDRYDDHIFIILQFPSIQKAGHSPRFSQLSLFVGENYIITISQGDLKPLSDIFQTCKLAYQEDRQNIMGTSCGYLLHSILDVLVDDLFHISMKVIGNLHDIEDVVFDEKVAVPKEIAILRRETTTLRRIVIPLKKILLEIISRDVKRLSNKDKEEDEDLISYFDDINDHVSKVLDALEESKETIEIYKDTDFMLSTEKTNKILSFLTLLFTFSIPVTIAGTFYGMNIPIPGSINKAHSLYDYIPLIIVLLSSIMPTILMMWYFKRLGWIDKLTTR